MKSFVHTVFAAVLSLLIAAQALATEKVNINTADAAALDRVLVGVGPSKAAAIVEYRKANGPFKSAEELAMVKGIGLSTVEQNRDRIELRTGAAPARKPAAAIAAPTKPVARRCSMPGPGVSTGRGAPGTGAGSQGETGGMPTGTYPYRARRAGRQQVAT